jgi:hypothetical protein
MPNPVTIPWPAPEMQGRKLTAGERSGTLLLTSHGRDLFVTVHFQHGDFVSIRPLEQKDIDDMVRTPSGDFAIFPPLDSPSPLMEN